MGQTPCCPSKKTSTNPSKQMLKINQIQYYCLNF